MRWLGYMGYDTTGQVGTWNTSHYGLTLNRMDTTRNEDFNYGRISPARFLLFMHLPLKTSLTSVNPNYFQLYLQAFPRYPLLTPIFTSDSKSEQSIYRNIRTSESI